MLLKRLFPFAAVFFVAQMLLRLSLMARAYFDVEFDASNIILILVKGIWFDVVVGGFFLLPVALYWLALGANMHGSAIDKWIDRAMRFIFCFIVMFDAVAEHLFWSEFTTRFNFIAVDYLVYTQEVIGNIVESYPLYWLILAITLAAFIITAITVRLWPLTDEPVNFIKRVKACMVMAALCALLYSASTIDQATIKDNAEGTELAANGMYNLFSAFWNNEISYGRFYNTMPENEIIKNARHLLFEPETKFIHDDGKDLTRLIESNRKEQHKNVMLVVMESMSADYMAAFGNTANLTPNLDLLAKEGIFFTDLYATGTRTVRGLEAVTLSIPPTPGQSIVRRPGNENLFSLGFIFKDRGYDTRFIYGGYGYFDNMNAFFAGNGFDIIDRNVMPKQDIQFANVWGICDEDMFNRAIKEADASYASKKPFMHLIMTTSNHRPFTYPGGKIDIAPHSGRDGGVKYADYAVGKLIEAAKQKPWFKDTVFVFVADHTAGAGGKAELDPRKYHIPMIFYAPNFIKPMRYEKTASQIDMAPVLLGLLHFSYPTKFFGEDLLHDDDEIPHAFISNYQKVGLVKGGELTVLSPKRKVEEYSWPGMNTEKSKHDYLGDAITYYQSASWWREQFKRIPTKIGQP